MTKRDQRPQPGPAKGDDPAHAPGKRKRGAPPAMGRTAPKSEPASGQHDQPWVPTSGLVGRSRRSPKG